MKNEHELIRLITAQDWTVTAIGQLAVSFRTNEPTDRSAVARLMPGWEVAGEGTEFTARIPMRKITAHKGGRTETTTVRMTKDVADMAETLRREHGLSMADLLEAAVKQKTYELRK